MKSKVKMEFDFNANKAYLSLEEIESEDVRDMLFKRFLHQLGSASNWCRVDREKERLFSIYPISQDELFWHGVDMLNRHFHLADPDEDTKAFKLLQALKEFGS